MSSATEVRVGVFVLAALGLLVGFVLALGDFSLSPRLRLHVDFSYAGGLQAGAPVKVSGIRVGRVAEMTLLGPEVQPPAAPVTARPGGTAPPVVRASLALDRAVRPLLTDGAQLYVGMQGFVGEAYVELQPGAAGGAAIPEDSSVRGIDAPRLHVMALEMSALLDTLASLVGPGARLGELGVALASVLTTTGELMAEHKSALGSAIEEIAGIGHDLRHVSGAMRAAVGDGAQLHGLLADSSLAAAELRRELPELLARTRASMEAVETLLARVGRAADAGEIETMLGDLKQTLTYLQHTALDARRVMDSVRRGQGTVGALVTDPQIYDDLKEVLRDVKRNPWKLLWRE